MRFEWNETKNQKNTVKHGVSFQKAAEIFEDPLHLSVLDKRFSYFEERWITIGRMENEMLLVAVHLLFTEEGEEVIRIISARRATAHERKQYEEI